jgi:hypothetical protein
MIKRAKLQHLADKIARLTAPHRVAVPIPSFVSKDVGSGTYTDSGGKVIGGPTEFAAWRETHVPPGPATGFNLVIVELAPWPTDVPKVDNLRHVDDE